MHRERARRIWGDLRKNQLVEFWRPGRTVDFRGLAEAKASGIVAGATRDGGGGQMEKSA